MNPDLERDKHVRIPRGKKNAGCCAECLTRWPCIVGRLVIDLDRAERQIERLTQKPSLPELVDVETRPRLPRRRRDGCREWTPRAVVEHLAWMRSLAEILERVGLHAFMRAGADVDDGQGSPEIEGGGTPQHEEDGSRTGRVPNQALAHEHVRVRRDPQTGAVLRNEKGEPIEDARWKPDPIALAMTRFLIGMEDGGDGMVIAYEMAKFLYGLTPEDARRLIDPQPGRCENEFCNRMVEDEGDDRLIIDSRDGKKRCEACSRYKRRHGEERPLKLCHPEQST